MLNVRYFWLLLYSSERAGHIKFSHGRKHGQFEHDPLIKQHFLGLWRWRHEGKILDAENTGQAADGCARMAGSRLKGENCIGRNYSKYPHNDSNVVPSFIGYDWLFMVLFRL